MSRPWRVAVASIIQETNTFSPRESTLADFAVQGLWTGAEADERSRGSNTEIAGALERLREAGVDAVPVVRAWAMSDGILAADAMAELERMLVVGLAEAGPLDAVVLCLHGALVAVDAPAADARLAAAARYVVGPIPLVVTHDLHANVTPAVIRSATAVIGFHTYPHVDQAATGRRAAELVLAALGGQAPGLGTVLAKRPMLVPAEAQAIADEPMAGIRRLADALTHGPVLDVSIFPVQPWLDVPHLGFGVTVTYTGDEEVAIAAAEAVADAAWNARADFTLDLVPVDDAVASLGPAGPDGPAILVHSADSPTAGATADDATVIGALLKAGRPLRAIATVVDAPAVARCWEAGVGATVDLGLGATLDDRWSSPVAVTGVVRRVDETPVVLTGASMTGQEIALGRWATVETDSGLAILVTERPAPTFDPQGFRHAGLEPADADVVVVRSATMFRAGFRGLHSSATVLDLPGASTPAFGYLDFVHAPRPLFGLDAMTDLAPAARR